MFVIVVLAYDPETILMIDKLKVLLLCDIWQSLIDYKIVTIADYSLIDSLSLTNYAFVRFKD